MDPNCYRLPQKTGMKTNSTPKRTRKPRLVEVVLRGCIFKVSPARAQDLAHEERTMTQADWKTNRVD